MKIVHYAVGILFTFCLIITILITSVEAVTYWTPGYYEKEYTKYNVTADVRMEMEDLLDVTREMMAYLRGSREDLHVPTVVDGQPREFFNDREIAHMEDVRDLFLAAILLRRICILGIILSLILIAVTKGKLSKVLPKTIFFGTLLFFGAAAFLGLVISTDFSKYFIVFHHIFFDNDLWILDPSVDMLINIVPEGFFRDTAARIIITYGILAVSVLLISFLLMKRNQTPKHKGEIN